MTLNETLVSRYLYRTPYVDDSARFKKEIISKTVRPYQVEIQPGPTGNKICWLECPFCYGRSAEDTGERLSKSRYIELIKEIADGGVKKVIFSGWATDPLFYQYIDDLVETALESGLIIGFNTRAIKATDRLIDLITRQSVPEESYISVSVDSGDDTSYSRVHTETVSTGLYQRVYDNVQKLKVNRDNTGGPLFISTTYLINQNNSDSNLILKYIDDYQNIGVDLIRFSFPQIPRGSKEGERDLVLSFPERASLREKLKPIIQRANTGRSKILFFDDEDLIYEKRTTPCYSRFVYPAIGFDGWLYHCSQSAGPNFHATALGNLAEKGFWELFYNYNISDIDDYLRRMTKCFDQVDCRCDRKEHTLNSSINRSLVVKP